MSLLLPLKALSLLLVYLCNLLCIAWLNSSYIAHLFRLYPSGFTAPVQEGYVVSLPSVLCRTFHIRTFHILCWMVFLNKDTTLSGAASVWLSLPHFILNPSGLPTISASWKLVNIEGSRPEWCISSMIYSGDTPFWLETLDMYLVATPRPSQLRHHYALKLPLA